MQSAPVLPVRARPLELARAAQVSRPERALEAPPELAALLGPGEQERGRRHGRWRWRGRRRSRSWWNIDQRAYWTASDFGSHAGDSNGRGGRRDWCAGLPRFFCADKSQQQWHE